MTRRQARAVRLARRAVSGTLMGALVMTGPWSQPAVGHDGPETARSGPVTSRGPEPEEPGRYRAPFGPYPGPRREPARTSSTENAWTSPVSGHPVTAAYGVPGGWAAGHHTGVDFATPVGTTIRSVGPGTVVLAEYSGAYGNLVVTKMTDGYYVLYAHLSDISVRAGQQVKGGTTIGESGNTGRSTGPHLHFEVRSDLEYGTDVDPMEYLSRYGVRLT